MIGIEKKLKSHLIVEKNFMNPEQIKKIIEGALMAFAEPLTLEQLQQLFAPEPPSTKELREILQSLAEDYADSALELKEVASGYRFHVRSELSPWISKLWEEKPPRYSRALLETLALIAYRQPITRAEIEEVRGVTVSSHIIKTLTDREWIRVVGHREVPGKPALYATTKQFLDDFNLKSLEQLPTLEEIREIDAIENNLELQQLQLAVSNVEMSVEVVEAELTEDVS